MGNTSTAFQDAVRRSMRETRSYRRDNDQFRLFAFAEKMQCDGYLGCEEANGEVMARAEDNAPATSWSGMTTRREVIPL